LGALLISIGFKFQGLPAKIVMILGMLGVFKAVFLLKGKASERIVRWFAAKPLIYFRIGACFHIAIGVILLTLR